MEEIRIFKGKRIFIAIIALLMVSFACATVEVGIQEQTPVPTREVREVINFQPTFTPAAETELPNTGTASAAPGVGSDLLVQLHNQLNPGVVNINVFVNRTGQVGEGQGSGFILDDEGHIVTNSHVVAGSSAVTVVFFNGFEAAAEVIGTDPESDLAVIRVDTMPEEAHPLPLGNSADVRVGEWVIAIGNPFGANSSMTVGIVSATGRQIPSLGRYRIPEAIQTDAAINPGNSGGPLLNLNGEVIGVNAQIATGGGIAANAGVGFAIPVRVVRHVIPTLMETGTFQWPYLGVEGDSVGLAIAEANNLQEQRGAYIVAVTPGGPAAQAGLQGSTGRTSGGVQMGGDIVLEANGVSIGNFGDLLATVAFSHPGDTINLTVLRNGELLELDVTLAPRP